jgi:hypothetical protein
MFYYSLQELCVWYQYPDYMHPVARCLLLLPLAEPTVDLSPWAETVNLDGGFHNWGIPNMDGL